MRGTSDLSSTYPFSVSPAGGWGNPNPDNKYVVADVSRLGKAIKINDDKSFERVGFEAATRFDDAASAAIASGKLADQARAAVLQ